MSRKQKRELYKIGCSAFLFLSGIVLPWIFSALSFIQYLAFALQLTAYLIVGLDVLAEAFSGIRNGQLFDENFLMAVATVGALLIGEYHEAVAVMLFYQIGEWFQRYAVGKSRASIAELMDIRPETATVERGENVETVDPEEVNIGEIIVVRAGERIPLDSVVVSGVSSLDTSALTGESFPRDVTAGDEVISGCINQTGLLRLRTTKVYSDSTVARILELVENASDKKAKVESFITRFSRIYTPTVCCLALLLFLVPSLIWGQWTVWGYRALSFLVVSCPCALVISVPLSFFGGIGAASRHGILVKGSNHLEQLAQTSTVVFDKTGTLTKGRFRVTEAMPVGVDKQTLLHTAALAEMHSNHPISRCVCETVDLSTLSAGECLHVEEKPGLGIVAEYHNRVIAAGNARLMALLGIRISTPALNGTSVHVAENNTYLGYLTVSDELKPDAKETLAALRRNGVKRTVLLTGDQQTAAEAIASQLSINELHAQLLPQDKVMHVERLLADKQDRQTLIYVGDGINDAPVLARADVGVAMGALGSDAAVEAADVVLMDDNPLKLALAIHISRRTLAIVRQNIVFALTVKLLVLGMVALGAAGMWLAVFADVGVSVIAILNAMRVLNTKSF